MKKTIVLAVVCLASATILTGCGGDSSPKGSPKASVPKQQILSTNQLASAVLDGADLSSDYSAVAMNPVYSGKPTYFCNYTPPVEQKVRVERDFVEVADTNQLVELSIRQFADAKAAKSSFDALEKAMEGCKGETSGGSAKTYTTSTIAGVGDRALRVSASYESGGFTQDLAVKGPVVVSVYGSGSKSNIPDDASLQDLLVKQLERYLTVAANPPAKNDADGDGDGTPDVSDAFPFNKAEAADANQNGIGDNADAELKRKVAKAKFLSKKRLAIVMKDPAAHAGEVFKVWGNITQFDSATGTTNFLANIAATDTTSYGYFEGDDAFFEGGQKLLKRVVQEDTFTATVRVVGSYTYSTAAGGSNTTPYLEVRSIQVR